MTELKRNGHKPVEARGPGQYLTSVCSGRKWLWLSPTAVAWRLVGSCVMSDFWGGYRRERYVLEGEREGRRGREGERERKNAWQRQGMNEWVCVCVCVCVHVCVWSARGWVVAVSFRVSVGSIVISPFSERLFLCTWTWAQEIFSVLCDSVYLAMDVCLGIATRSRSAARLLPFGMTRQRVGKPFDPCHIRADSKERFINSLMPWSLPTSCLFWSFVLHSSLDFMKCSETLPIIFLCCLN